MYNGIGLASARGSGTNGYVQRNLSHAIKSHPTSTSSRLGGQHENDDPKRPFRPKADQSILDHNKKRQVEVECMEFRAELEKEGVLPNQIDVEVEQLRQSLIAKFSTHTDHENFNGAASKKFDSHSMYEAKERENDRMRNALGFDRNKNNGYEERRAADSSSINGRERNGDYNRENRGSYGDYERDERKRPSSHNSNRSSLDYGRRNDKNDDDYGRRDRYESRGGYERRDRNDRNERDDRYGRDDRNGRDDRYGRDDRNERDDRYDRNIRNERDDRFDRNSRDDRNDRNSRDDRNDRNSRDDRFDRNDRYDRNDRFERNAPSWERSSRTSSRIHSPRRNSRNDRERNYADSPTNLPTWNTSTSRGDQGTTTRSSTNVSPTEKGWERRRESPKYESTSSKVENDDNGGGGWGAIPSGNDNSWGSFAKGNENVKPEKPQWERKEERRDERKEERRDERGYERRDERGYERGFQKRDERGFDRGHERRDENGFSRREKVENSTSSPSAKPATTSSTIAPSSTTSTASALNQSGPAPAVHPGRAKLLENWESISETRIKKEQKADIELNQIENMPIRRMGPLPDQKAIYSSKGSSSGGSSGGFGFGSSRGRGGSGGGFPSSSRGSGGSSRGGFRGSRGRYY